MHNREPVAIFGLRVRGIGRVAAEFELLLGHNIDGVTDAFEQMAQLCFAVGSIQCQLLTCFS